jgi:hypothetical protein
MTTTLSMKNSHFEQVDDVQTDSRNRISLTRKIGAIARHYRIYRDSMTGRILLEPMKLMPVSDNWLDFAPEAKAAVEKGLADLKAGRTHKAPRDI